MKPLSNPPLVEAVFEVAFMPSAFDLTIPGLLWSEIREEYENKKEHPVQLAMKSLDNKPGSIDIIQTQVTQFFTRDESKVVQVGKGLLVLNRIRYISWEDFKAEILRIYNIYMKFFEQAPIIRQASLKYINIFHFDKNIDPTTKFSFKFSNPPLNKYSTIKALQYLNEFETEYGDVLSSQFKSLIPPNIQSQSFSMEINNLNNSPGSITLESLSGWLDKAHKSAENLFIDSLSKTYYHSFK